MLKIKQLIFASHNPGKIAEIKKKNLYLFSWANAKYVLDCHRKSVECFRTNKKYICIDIEFIFYEFVEVVCKLFFCFFKST